MDSCWWLMFWATLCLPGKSASYPPSPCLPPFLLSSLPLLVGGFCVCCVCSSQNQGMLVSCSLTLYSIPLRQSLLLSLELG